MTINVKDQTAITLIDTMKDKNQVENDNDHQTQSKVVTLTLDEGCP